MLAISRKGSSNMDPNCAVEELSVSLRSCEPFSVSENDPSKSLVAQDILGPEVLVGAFNSINTVESSGQRDEEVTDNVKFDDASEMKCPGSSPPRKSAHITKLNQKTQTRKAVGKCGKTVIKKPLLDSDLLRVARKRRSYFCKPARSSIWGSLGYITQVFELNTGVNVDQNEHTKPQKSRGAQGSGKRNKNKARASSQKSKGKTRASSGHIRLKVTLGKKIGQTNVASITNNGLENYWGTSTEVPKLTNGAENKFREEMYAINGFHCSNGDPEKVVMLSDASHLDICVANKDLESSVIREKSAGVTANNPQRVLSQIEDEGLGVAGDNRYLDSGTSPDSEVINLTPEAQVNGKIQEDVHDVLFLTPFCVAPGDVASLNLPQKNSKKGKKEDKLYHAGNFIVEDRLPSPEIINKTSAHGEKMEYGFYSSEASISTTTANVSGNTSRCEGFSREPLPLSRVTDCGVSCEGLKVESGTEGDLCFGLESPESHVSDKLCPYTKTKRRKHVKSSKSRRVRESGSEVSDSSRSLRGNACRQKGNPVNSVNRRKAKDKGASDQVVCKVENHLETGDQSSDDPGKTKTGDESTTRDKFKLDMGPRVVGEQYPPPRNAWVCCDDCFKWRRIPATLADTIEETNCRWTCKDSTDKSFADCSIPQELSNAEINVELEISDASCEEDACDTRLNSKRLEAKHSTVHQQSSWMPIKSNLFLHRSRKTQTIDEIMVCHCKPPPDGRMGCGDGCLNRMLNIECVQGTCPCGKLCSNQQFQKRKYAKLRWLRCGKKGYGLQLIEDISEGQFLIEYVGEVLDILAYEARQREYASKGHKHFYFMALNGSEVIDACAKGHLGRFINHSCDPNCRTEKWMVNGEVCIGLFALRTIKKGEELTFDYNYVRVFGAAAKKCVCGSSQCRGYIGGDPLNAEVIVQGDSDEDYPEPVMVYKDGEIDDDLKILISATSSFDGTEMQIADQILANKDKMDKSATAVGHLDSTTELQAAEILVKDEDETDKAATAVQYFEITPERNSSNKSASGAQLQNSLEMENSVEKLPPVQQVDTTTLSKTITDAQQEFVKKLETPALTVISGKSLSDTIDAKKKCKSDTIENRRTSKPHLLMKTSRSSSLVKKGKLNSNSANVDKPKMIVSKSHVLPYKPKKLLEGSLNGRFEAVEVKLNELLEADGGISKRKDAPKGYLKLLLLTATSGDSGNGEAIQSNRDLSMILDALLKTKSRMVLVDIINKNGLQMLHNIMKRYRRDFNKIPILRKLLKVLEYLAVREILSLEHINGGPPCPGVESFRESILTLTEHDDKQVHQIARNFRDRWIPRPARKSSCMDRSDGRVEFHLGSNCTRYSVSHNHWKDQGVKTTEAINCIKKSIVATNSVDAGTLEGSFASSSTGFPISETKTRKRKSRWDQPAETKTDVRSPQQKEAKIQPSLLQKSHSGLHPEISEVVLDHINGINRENKRCPGGLRNVSQQMEANRADDAGQNIDEDVPPGFLPPLNGPLVPSIASSTVTYIHRENGVRVKCPHEVVMGHPHGKFMNRLPVSYGIPLPVVQQCGTPRGETLESWVTAPGMPFHPFPPLPPYSHDKREPTACAGNLETMNQPAEKDEKGSRHPAICQSDQNTPSTSGASLLDLEIQGANDLRTFQQVSGSHSLGRRYFKQQKCNNTKLGPPWILNRNDCGFMGNNTRNEMCSIGVATVANEIKGPNSSEDVSTGKASACNTFH